MSNPTARSTDSAPELLERTKHNCLVAAETIACSRKIIAVVEGVVARSRALREVIERERRTGNGQGRMQRRG